MLQLAFLALAALIPGTALASEAELHIPELSTTYNLFGSTVAGTTLLGWGIVVGFLGMIFGLVEFMRIKKLPAHQSMLDISALIYETCKTYLFQQGKLLILLEVFIGICIFYYFKVLQGMDFSRVLLILLWSALGILGSFGVAWFGIRINT